MEFLLITWIIGFFVCAFVANLDAIRIGQRVRLVFKPTEAGPPVPTFTPASAL